MRISHSIALACILCAQAAMADVVVVVSAKSAVGPLTGEQLQKLFLAKTSDFPSGGSATLLDQNDGPTRSEFYTKFLKKDVTQMRAYWAKLQFTGKVLPPKEVGGDADMKKQLTANPGAIGYIDKAAVDGSVKVVGAPE